MAALAFTSPLRAAPRDTIVLTGQTESPVATKIRAELAARGLDVREGEAPEGATRVTVHADGHVTVEEAGAPPEDLRADADENVFARRVAENVRARMLAPSDEPKPTPAPPSPPPEPPPAAPPEPPPAEPTPPVDPARRFAQRGALLLSVDDALPILSVGRAAPLAGINGTQIGQLSGRQVPTSPRPFSLDYSVINGLTIGVTPIIEQTIAKGDRASVDGAAETAIRFAGGGARLGYVAPFGRHVVVWPRLGLTYFRWTEPIDPGVMHYAYETSATADLRVGWTPTGRWMFTVGPSVSVPLSHSSPTVAPPPSLDVIVVSHVRSEDPRIALSAGLTVKLDDDETPNSDAPEAAAPARFLLGVEHVAPLVRLRVRNGGRMAVDLGTADTTNAFSTMPRLAFDAVAAGKLTVGGAASIGFVPRTSTASAGVELALAPRVGGLFQLTKSFALWPRAGVTWLYSRQSDAYTAEGPAHRLAADIDTFAILSPAPGVGITLGPSLSIPITLSQSSESDAITLLGVSAGIVLFL